MPRTLYDAYQHASSESDLGASSTPSTTTATSSRWTLAPSEDSSERASRERDDESAARGRGSIGVSTSAEADSLAIHASDGRVRVYRSKDDWHRASGGTPGLGWTNIGTEDARTRWSDDGRAFAFERMDGKMFVANRVGEIVWTNDDEVTASHAGFGLALRRETTSAYDLLSVNLKGTPAVTRARVSLESECSVFSSSGSREHEKRRDAVSLGKALRCADGAEWLENRRTLVVVGRRHASTGSTITTWVYDNADDFLSIRNTRTIECNHDAAPRRSFFRTPFRLHLAVRITDETLGVAATSWNGRLSVFYVSHDDSSRAETMISRENVRAATWWSSRAVAIATRDGHLTVQSIQDDSHVLGDEPESFDSIEDLVSAPRDVDGIERGRLLLLERPRTGGWRLISINERTPAEMLQSHMEMEEWGVALTLARQHGLDTDEVYKARWERSIPSKEGLTDWLSRISDRAWVGVQCLVARTDSYETQRHILVYGLKESDAQAKRSEHGDSSTGAALVTWNWWVKLRLALLGAIDRADAVHEVTGGAFSSELFSNIIGAPIREVAINAAYANDIALLSILFKRFSRALRAHMFEVISAIPETSDVGAYESLLPWSGAAMTRDDSEHFGSRRAVDWAESETYAQAIASNSPDGDKVLAQSAGVDPSSARILNDVASKEWLMSATERICTLTERENGLPSEMEMEAWAIKRSCEMDEYAGAIDNAHGLLQRASTALKTKTLVDFAYASGALASSAYICFDTNRNDVTNVNFEEFLANDASGRLSTILSMMNDSNSSRLMSGPVTDLLKYQSDSSVGGCEGSRELLQRFILSDSEKGDLEQVSRIVRWLSSDEEHVKLVGGAEALAAVVVEASLSHECADLKLTSELAHILNGLPPIVAEVPIAKKAISRINACKTLQVNAASVNLRDVLEAEQNTPFAIRLIRNHVEHFVNGHEILDWSRLWSDLHALQTGVFARSLTHEQVLGELLCAQLRKKDWTHARRHVPSTSTGGAVGALVGGLKELGQSVSSVLPPSTAEELILLITDEFFSLSKDITDEASSAAEICLRLIPVNQSTGNLQQKLDFLHGMRFLAKYGVLHPPNAVTHEVALDLILTAVKQSHEVYLMADELQDVAIKFGLRDEKPQGAILLEAGTKALDVGDVTIASTLASRLMRRDYAPAWRLCMQVARRMNNEYSSGVEKERLLAFALIYADRDCLASLLGDWQTAQTNEMLSVFKKPIVGERNCGSEAIGFDAQGEVASDPESVRPLAKEVMKHPQFSRALDCLAQSSADSSKAARTIAYALGVHGSNVSDEILMVIARSSIKKALRDCKSDDVANDTPPRAIWPSVGVLLALQDPENVSDVVNEISSATHDKQALQAVLHLGTCAHALRALRSHWTGFDDFKTLTSVSALVDRVMSVETPSDDAEMEIHCIKQLRSSVSSVVDAEWLATMVPEIDANVFSSGTAAYRRKAIMALAAGSSATLSSAEALDNALRLANVYQVDSYDVYTAYAANLANDNEDELRRAVPTLTEALSSQPSNSAEMLQNSVWPTLPKHGDRALSSANCYFQVMAACDGAVADNVQSLTNAMASLSSACPGINLHAFVNGKGAAPRDGADGALSAVQAAIMDRGQTDFPMKTLESIVAAMNTLPNELRDVPTEDVYFSAMRAFLSPPSRKKRPSPENRWNASRCVLEHLGEHYQTVVADVLCGITHSSPFKELNVFSAELSSRTRLKAIEDVVSVVGEGKLVEVETVAENLRLVDSVTRQIQHLHPRFALTLEEHLMGGKDLQDVGIQWIRDGATFRQISLLATIAESQARSAEKLDVLLAISSAVSASLLNVSDNGSTEISRIVHETLRDGPAEDETLNNARTNTFAQLKEFAELATPNVRAHVLNILSELVDDETSLWTGWRSHSASDESANVLSMRTSALIAPYGLELPDEVPMVDVESMCSYFANALVNESKIPFEVLTAILDLWEDPVKRPKIRLKPCWIALLRRGLKDCRGLDIVTEQCLRDGANTANRWMSDDDVLELYDEAKSSAHDEPIATKLAFLLGKFEGEDEVLVWDVEAVALAIHAQRIPEVYEASRASYDALIETALSHERGRSVLLPQILAALTRAHKFEAAAALATKLSTTHPIFAADFEARLVILRKQLDHCAQRRNDIGFAPPARVSEESSTCRILFALFSETTANACRSASGVLELALVARNCA